jgi:hypothetical protein
LLNKDQHRLLIEWACKCTAHLLYLTGGETDERILNALRVAEEWKEGHCSTGDARKASVAAITAANETPDPVAKAIARSAGHAIATAHMADHCVGAALYGLKALHLSKASVDEERRWQNDQIPPELRDITLTLRNGKEKSFKLH